VEFVDAQTVRLLPPTRRSNRHDYQFIYKADPRSPHRFADPNIVSFARTRRDDAGTPTS